MTKIVVQPNASGTGTFTIAAPNSSNTQTLTLPDETGSVLTDQSSLPAANLTGTLPAIDGSSLTNLPVVGVDQTWQNPSRAANTSYQNTTGKPIMVNVYGNTTGLYLQVSANNSTWVTVVGGYSNTATSVAAIIPNGIYYRAHTSASFISTWAELR